jgi:hypothetical protein
MPAQWQCARLVAPACLIVALLGLVGPALAHESRPAYLEIKETAPNHYSVLWRTPVLSGNRLLVTLKLPDGVSDLEAPISQQLSDSRVDRRWIDAGPDGLAGKRIEFIGLQLTITDVLARVELLDGRELTMIARPSQPFIIIAGSQTSLQVALTYTAEGIRHIGSGFDHLLFIFALVLIVSNGWMLFKTVTAFTVAHSITLALATLGIVQPARPPVEVAIALSILFLAPEIVRKRQGRTSFNLRHPWVVAFAFGLLHGFGFAGVLLDAGLPRSELPVALFSFNIGVEIGQLAFVSVVLLLIAACRKWRIVWPRSAQFVPAYAVGTLGAFWTIRGMAQMLRALI